MSVINQTKFKSAECEGYYMDKNNDGHFVDGNCR